MATTGESPPPQEVTAQAWTPRPTLANIHDVGADAAHASDHFRESYERELRVSLAPICDGDEEKLDDAIASMTLDITRKMRTTDSII
jgi:hypothetical protein